MATKEIMKRSHPAKYIKDAIGALEISNHEFAVRSGISDKVLSTLLNEKANITLDIAQKLSAFFGTSISVWMNLQISYDLCNKRKQLVEYDEQDIKYLKQIDKQFLIDIGIANKGDDEYDLLNKVRSAVQVSRLSNLGSGNLYASLKQAKKKRGNNLFLQNFWITLALNAARKEDGFIYNERKLKTIMHSLRVMTIYKPEDFYGQIVYLLNSVGVHVISLPYLKGSGIFGVTKWIDDNKSPMIALSNRNLANDQFWFTLFHELFHVLDGHKRAILMSGDDEKYTDERAADYLISKMEWNSFIDQGDFSRGAIVSFSEEIIIHPAIILGRLYKEGKVPYGYYNDLREYYHITHNAS